MYRTGYWLAGPFFETLSIQKVKLFCLFTNQSPFSSISSDINSPDCSWDLGT
jgi:hypothetical protein